VALLYNGLEMFRLSTSVRNSEELNQYQNALWLGRFKFTSSDVSFTYFIKMKIYHISIFITFH
jgi:hypothetical protein